MALNRTRAARLRRLILLAVTAGFTLSAYARPDRAAAVPRCQPDGPVVALPDLSEASGIAASHRMAGRLWAINDSGDPLLFLLDMQGAVQARVRLTGASVDDWEAITVGPCAAGSCVYVADIGDNQANRQRVTIYRVPEPHEPGVRSAQADTIHATYPDGPHDAESLLITPEGVVYVVTKGDTGPVALYRTAGPLRGGGHVSLERVGAPREQGRLPKDERITDAAMSPDGQWIVLRTHHDLRFYRASELLAGNWEPARVVNVAALGEPQGEGVAFGPDSTVYLNGEGGGKSRPGTFARLSCTFDR